MIVGIYLLQDSLFAALCAPLQFSLPWQQDAELDCMCVYVYSEKYSFQCNHSLVDVFMFSFYVFIRLTILASHVGSVRY